MLDIPPTTSPDFAAWYVAYVGTDLARAAEVAAHIRGKPITVQVKALPKKQSIPLGQGVGTELKLLLQRWGIHSSDDCSCMDNARRMNQNGPEWCEKNMELITDWMEAQSKERPIAKFFFSRFAAKKMIELAIRNWNKKSSKDVIELPPDVPCENC